MDILIDTQILIWSFDINSPLTENYKKLLVDINNRVFVSQISLMEVAIKRSINKLPGFVPKIENVVFQLLDNGFEILKLTDQHIFTYQSLPLFQEHRDPFDRFLIATAKRENLTVMTTDIKFQLYSSFIKIV